MFKKTKMRSILERLGQSMSAREVSRTLGVSRNTVAEVQRLYESSGNTWDDISGWDDEMLYALFYPDKFKHTHAFYLSQSGGNCKSCNSPCTFEEWHENKCKSSANAAETGCHARKGIGNGT